MPPLLTPQHDPPLKFFAIEQCKDTYKDGVKHLVRNGCADFVEAKWGDVTTASADPILATVHSSLIIYTLIKSCPMVHLMMLIDSINSGYSVMLWPKDNSKIGDGVYIPMHPGGQRTTRYTATVENGGQGRRTSLPMEEIWTKDVDVYQAEKILLQLRAAKVLESHQKLIESLNAGENKPVTVKNPLPNFGTYRGELFIKRGYQSSDGKLILRLAAYCIRRFFGDDFCGQVDTLVQTTFKSDKCIKNWKDARLELQRKVVRCYW